MQDVCSRFPYKTLGPINRGKKPQLIDICVALENRARILRGGAESESGEWAVFYAPAAIHRVSAVIHDYLLSGEATSAKEVDNLLQAMDVLDSLRADVNFTMPCGFAPWNWYIKRAAFRGSVLPLPHTRTIRIYERVCSIRLPLRSFTTNISTNGSTRPFLYINFEFPS